MTNELLLSCTLDWNIYKYLQLTSSTKDCFYQTYWNEFTKATCTHERPMLCLIVSSSGNSSGRMLHRIIYNLDPSPPYHGLRTTAYDMTDANLG